MDTGIIGGVLTLPDFKQEFGLDGFSSTASANLSANLVSTMQAGAIIGALAALPLSEKLGRKPSLMIIAVFAFIGGFMQAFSNGNFATFYAGRVIEGLGLGGATMLAPTYVSENSPRAIRGLLIGFYQLFETMGAMIAFFIDYGSLLHIKVSLILLQTRTLINSHDLPILTKFLRATPHGRCLSPCSPFLHSSSL